MPARTLTTTRPAAGRTTHQPTHVVLYVRVSSKDQEAEGFSIPAQVRLLREYAASKGFMIVREFEDVETAKAIEGTYLLYRWEDQDGNPIRKLTITARLNSGRPRQFSVIWQNIRCSILFHLLVPGGK